MTAEPSLEEPLTLDVVRDDPEVFLLPDGETIEVIDDAVIWLEKRWKARFEHVLRGWDYGRVALAATAHPQDVPGMVHDSVALDGLRHALSACDSRRYRHGLPRASSPLGAVPPLAMAGKSMNLLIKRIAGTDARLEEMKAARKAAQNANSQAHKRAKADSERRGMLAGETILRRVDRGGADRLSTDDGRIRVAPRRPRTVRSGLRQCPPAIPSTVRPAPSCCATCWSAR
jgi:hypothetical protein